MVREFETITSFKRVDRNKLNTITHKVNKVIQYFEVRKATDINNLLKAVSMCIAEKLGLN